MRATRPTLIALGAALSLTACGSSSHDATATTHPTSSSTTPTTTASSASSSASSSTTPTSSATTSSTSSETTSSTQAWDPNSSLCDLLDPVGEKVMGAKPLPMSARNGALGCEISYQSTGSGPTPKLSLGQIQDSISGQVTQFQQGVPDARVSSADGPTPGAKWVFATGSPDMEMLYWTGADGYAWKLQVESSDPASRKGAMLEAARQINTRVHAK